jgi:hypothetical protein
MTRHTKPIILFSFGAFLLVNTLPEKAMGAEATPSRAQKQETSQPQSGPSSPDKKNQDTLTPEQKGELEIDEDNVMNPYPG